MIYPGTKVLCKDNCGALTLKCISILNSSKKKGATSGSLVVLSVKTCLKGSKKIWKGSLQYGVVIRTKSQLTRLSKTGEYLNFFLNSVVIVSKKNNFNPLGTRVFGPVSWEVRSKTFLKIVLLSSGVF